MCACCSAREDIYDWLAQRDEIMAFQFGSFVRHAQSDCVVRGFLLTT